MSRCYYKRVRDYIAIFYLFIISFIVYIFFLWLYNNFLLLLFCVAGKFLVLKPTCARGLCRVSERGEYIIQYILGIVSFPPQHYKISIILGA